MRHTWGPAGARTRTSPACMRQPAGSHRAGAPAPGRGGDAWGVIGPPRGAGPGGWPADVEPQAVQRYSARDNVQPLAPYFAHGEDSTRTPGCDRRVAGLGRGRSHPRATHVGRHRGGRPGGLAPDGPSGAGWDARWAGPGRAQTLNRKRFNVIRRAIRLNRLRLHLCGPARGTVVQRSGAIRSNAAPAAPNRRQTRPDPRLADPSRDAGPQVGLSGRARRGLDDINFNKRPDLSAGGP